MKHRQMAQTRVGPNRVAHGLGLRRNRLVAVLALVGMVAAGSLAQSNDAAWAKDYPSWSDVLQARNNESAKKTEIARLQALIKQNEDAVASTEAIAAQKGSDYEKAQLAFDEAAYKTDQLQRQADAAGATAKESKKRAARMAAQLARVGGNDLSATLFFNGDSTTDLLAQLGMASKITDQSQGLYARAIQDQNMAQSLTDQANVAKAALKLLADAAQQALAHAQAAADAAAAALKEQQDRDATLQAQLATLTSDKVHTEAEYDQGVKARAAEAAAAAAAAAAAGGGQVAASGWARPVSGRVSSGYGPRVPPCGACSSFHGGVDVAAGYNTPIYAAHAGRIAYAGSFGGYGNYVRIDNGDGVSTAYAHIIGGGILVRVGQEVSAGQPIARVGSTGNSTGPHLHFEVRINGATTNPVTFLRDRGIELGR